MAIQGNYDPVKVVLLYLGLKWTSGMQLGLTVWGSSSLWSLVLGVYRFRVV